MTKALLIILIKNIKVASFSTSSSLLKYFYKKGLYFRTAPYISINDNKLVLFVLVGKVARLDVSNVLPYGIGHNGIKIGIATQELW